MNQQYTELSFTAEGCSALQKGSFLSNYYHTCQHNIFKVNPEFCLE